MGRAMGFVENAYNVLSPGSSLASWPSSGSTLQEELVKDANRDGKIKREEQQEQEQCQQRQQQQLISLDCKSWLLDRLLGRRTKAKNSSTKNKNTHHHQYERPPRWKQAIRKCRAEARKIHSSCYDSMCVDPKPLHHYKTESYERNFDRGREYWADLPFLDISPFCSPGSISRRTHCSSSSTAAMIQQQQGHGWIEEQQQQHQQQHQVKDHELVWQRSDVSASV